MKFIFWSRIIVEKPTKRNSRKQNWLVNSIKKAWALYLMIAAISGASIWGVFQAKIELKPEFSIDRTNPFMSYISIHNANNYFSIYEVTPIMEVDSIAFGNNSFVRRLVLESTSLPKDEIKPGDFSPFVFPVIESSKPKDGLIKYARVAYRIEYKFLMISKSERFNYLCVPNVDGEFEWQRMPTKEFLH